MIVSLLVREPRRITDLETYLTRTLAFALLALAARTLLLTNTLPVAVVVPASEPPDSNEGVATNPKNPYAYPCLVVMTTYHGIVGFYLYAQLTYGANFALSCGLVASGGLFCLGVWNVLFAGEKGRMSRKTGADKRTGNFPFTNAGSAGFAKKESKLKEKGKIGRTD